MTSLLQQELKPLNEQIELVREKLAALAADRIGPEAVEEFDREHAAVLSERFPSDPLAVPHRVFAILARR